tara:strand:+ start:106 stop:417 length:312 start_codon:yes stop_codon:yes gene_type:complete
METLERKDQFINDLTATDIFTYEGASALFDWLEDYYFATKGFAYYNPDDICHEWIQFQSINEFMRHYDTSDWELNTIEDFFRILAEHTQVIKINRYNFIIQKY